ncbi:MAG: sigma-54 dependent transcriptional regulator [Clostridia bacterium]|nr:sigma-54 dependent transcriptional regulator [Clostridia bacterium]
MTGQRVSVLAVDDDASLRTVLKVILAEKGFEVDAAADAFLAIAALERRSYDVVLLDMKMAGRTGLEVIPDIVAGQPNAVIIMMTAYGTIRTAVDALRAGAYDYITKPFDVDELVQVIHRGLDARAGTGEGTGPAAGRGDTARFAGIQWTCMPMVEAYSKALKLAQYDVTVLVTGESGTGKELVAHMLHENSPRSDGPFIKMNCAAVPETLLESELFGYEKGAFTGAGARKLGRFELADGGALFLDEVGDMSPAMQAKLLRVLQDGEFERVGGTDTIKVDVRIIAATNRDLGSAVRERRFRADLFYRLNTVTICLPPLRDRREDLPTALQYFLELFNRQFKRDFRGADEQAMDALRRHEWPGNVREFRNAIEHAVLLGDGQLITLAMLPESVRGGQAPLDPQPISEGSSIRTVEREHILRVLEACEWNQSRSAETLGIHRNTLRRKIAELGIERE